MGVGVFTKRTRVHLVRGWLTGGVDPADGSVECGDGTLYPIELANLDQAAKVWLRAKDAHLLSGDYLLVDTGTFPEIYRGVKAPYAASSERACDDSSSLFIRGYATKSGVGLSAHDVNYLGDEYSVNGVDYRDIADNERGMWMRAHPDNPWNSGDGDLLGVRNAFTINQSTGSGWTGPYHFAFYNESATLSPPTPPDTYYDLLTATTGAPADVIWYPYVAVVDDGGTKRYFMGFQFTAYPVSSNKNWGDFAATGTELSIKYKIELTSGEWLECPLYSDPGPDEVELSSSDFIHSVVEWWPYAKGSPATPVWNSLTGAKL